MHLDYNRSQTGDSHLGIITGDKELKCYILIYLNVHVIYISKSTEKSWNVMCTDKEKMRLSRRSLKNCEISESGRKSKAWENEECSRNRRKARRKHHAGSWARREFWGKVDIVVLTIRYPVLFMPFLCCGSVSAYIAYFLWWNQRNQVHPLPAQGWHRSRLDLWGHPLQ